MLLLLPTSGCLTYAALRKGPPPDFDKITVGASRDTVEEILGEPVARQHNLAMYEHDTEQDRLSRPARVPIIATIDAFTMGLVGLTHWSDIQRSYHGQKAVTTIAYAPDGRVVGVWRSGYPPSFTNMLTMHEPEHRRWWLCRSANSGYATAQAVQAMRYRYGLWKTPVDPPEAYLWLRLAAFGGHPGAEELAQEWAAKMPADQVAEAERRYRNWSPEECEAE